MDNPSPYHRNEDDLKFTIAQAKIGGGNMTKISQVSGINCKNISLELRVSK